MPICATCLMLQTYSPEGFAAAWVGIFALAFCTIANPVLALCKGYSFWKWLFSLACVGFLVVLFLPNTRKNDLPEEDRQQLRSRGDRLGLILTLVTIAIVLIGFVALAILVSKAPLGYS